MEAKIVYHIVYHHIEGPYHHDETNETVSTNVQRKMNNHTHTQQNK